MAQVFFTQQLARFTSVPQVETAAAELRAGIDSAFAVNPLLRGYVLDDLPYRVDVAAARVRRVLALTGVSPQGNCFRPTIPSLKSLRALTQWLVSLCAATTAQPIPAE